MWLLAGFLPSHALSSRSMQPFLSFWWKVSSSTCLYLDLKLPFSCMANTFPLMCPCVCAEQHALGKSSLGGEALSLSFRLLLGRGNARSPNLLLFQVKQIERKYPRAFSLPLLMPSGFSCFCYHNLHCNVEL